MRLPESKIELCVGAAGYNPNMKNVMLDCESSQLISTDGYILAVIPATIDEGDTTGMIPGEVFTKARRAKAHTIKANGAIRVESASEVIEVVRPEGTFPNWKAIIREQPKGKPTITLNAELLLSLAKAIKATDKSNPPVVSIWISDEQSAAFVKAGDGFGLIMPCRA